MNLYEKATELGIQTEFFDGQGQRHVTDAAALKLIIDAMPVRAPHRFLDHVVVVRLGEHGQSELTDAVAFPLQWKIRAGVEIVAQGSAEQRTVTWPSTLSIGSYHLDLTDASGISEDVPLIVAPPRAFGGDFDRSWILAVQLYGVRSPRNWGVGDFTDLERLIELAADLGADGVGLNPLHALFDDRPSDCSPYSPNSRLFLNPLYIDVEKLPEYSTPDVAAGRAERSSLGFGDTIDYTAVADAKWPALRLAFENFRRNPQPRRRAAFDEFRRQRAPLLSRFACFEALRHRLARPWWEWPDDLQHPDDARCAQLREGPDAEDIEFVEFVQWCADDQLRNCHERAAGLGMKVGLYLDVAVGVQSDGFDAWNEQVAISRHLSVGAPPDQLNSAGQNWGLAGFNAAGLEVTSFEPYRQMLRAAMRYAGAIRLDHVLGLNRLYLVPSGFAADHGVYVKMPFEALLAIAAQESVANRCVVIGEDLGTVPDGFREQLAAWGIWSYRVMMFERHFHEGWFFGVDHYLPEALVTFNTHDLATYAGWHSFADLHFKRGIGMDPGESDDARGHALTMLGHALRFHGIARDDFYGVVTFLARTRSRLLAVALEDLLGLTDQPNIPGTVNEHPNWRRRLPLAIDEIAAAIDRPALQAATAGRGKVRSVAQQD
ncbi:MAG: 4-alpha-glucanotransferase [Rhodopseudomonas sp.]|uniref:4-alpha-glucanotransferase n=1 Tax=Rhodopseudomonas sp. TaxID=1078 RepID=UPI0017929B8F|nr:4-alpha-glucanotransferase [Rhodopseudomonas sp.]NVN87595.1 4-alpha-glucanotransferase [Rhodopseudomonas sp.]